MVYVTVAHLFYRQVARNAPALPFLHWDWVYYLVFPTPRRGGLTPLAGRPCARWRSTAC